ncbi:hypothetical protein TNCV_4574691 [Trichonephila clavipes]|nr:hypothetical protein TNCV_4574691 [Trichonephila clavipes]
MSSHLLKLATRSYSLSHLRGSSPGAPRKVDGLLHYRLACERYGDRYPAPPPNLSRSSKEVHSSIKQTIRFILTLGARYNTGLRTCPTGDELCFYTLRNIREITSMHSKE